MTTGTAQPSEFASARFSAGRLNAMVKKIMEQAGNSGVRQFLAGEIHLRAGTKFLKPVKTIKIGTGLKNGQSFFNALREKGIIVYRDSHHILLSEDFTVAEEEAEFDVFIVTLGQLGLFGSPTFSEIYKRAESLFLPLCPLEVGPQLRLQYLDQPKGQQLFLMTNPVKGYHGGPEIFTIDHMGSGLSLSSRSCKPEETHFIDCSFIFARPVKK